MTACYLTLQPTYFHTPHFPLDVSAIVGSPINCCQKVYSSRDNVRFAENGKRLGVKFSGLSQDVADFLFSGSGKCQIRQRLLTE